MAKEIKFSEDARAKMLAGVDKLADTVNQRSVLRGAMLFWNNHTVHQRSQMMV